MKKKSFLFQNVNKGDGIDREKKKVARFNFVILRRKAFEDGVGVIS